MRSAPVAVALAGWLAIAAPAWAQQQQPDTLARAKDYYASAAYEEALDVLRKLNTAAPNDEAREIAVYQLFCLLALGRQDETRKAIETIVRADPLYHLSEDAASPRVRTLFEDTRRPLLPGIVKDLYTKAKAAFDKKESAEAAAGFDKVVAVIDDAGLADSPGIGDLLTLATGFRDLLSVPAAPAAPPPVTTPAPKTDPAPTSSTPSKPQQEAPRTYGPQDGFVIRPIAISNQVPAWRPTGLDTRQEFHGDLELLIDETGKVISAVLRRSVHRLYDPILIEAAQRWTFRPATFNGMPVRYRYVVEIHLKPGGDSKD